MFCKYNFFFTFHFNMVGFSTKTFEVFDDYMTPNEAWDLLLPFIPKDKVIWEAFYGDGNSGNYLSSLGLNVIHQNIDFFENDLGDIIVSNPPFSLKKNVLQRLKLLDKPFILIMPCSTLTTNYVRELFSNDIQIIVPPKRIQFIKLENGVLKQNNRCNFDCFFFCYKIGLDRDIVFIKK